MSNYLTLEKSLVVDHIKRDNLEFNMPDSHSHDSYEIYYLVEGERQYFIHDKNYHIQPGDIVLISPHIIHRTLVKDKPYHERYLVYIDAIKFQGIFEHFSKVDWFSAFEPNKPVLTLKPDEREEVKTKLEKLQKLYQSDDVLDKNMMQILLLELLLYLVKMRRNREESAGDESKKSTDIKQSEARILEVVKYINVNFAEGLPLQKLAETFYISEYHLSRSFKKNTGFGLNEYINKVRVLEAEKLLIHSNLSILDISLKVGYESSTHFGRVFKKIKGISAKEYRGRFQ